MSRPGWDEYFSIIATAVALRADCTRGKYGAVLVKDHRIISTGYNGSVSGGPSCLKGECPRGNSDAPSFKDGNHDFSDCISLHAEANCIAHANWQDCQDATLYINGAPPCDMCAKLIKAAGIERVVWK